MIDSCCPTGDRSGSGSGCVTQLKRWAVSREAFEGFRSVQVQARLVDTELSDELEFMRSAENEDEEKKHTTRCCSEEEARHYMYRLRLSEPTDGVLFEKGSSLPSAAQLLCGH